jgi:hypothetical protein
MMREIKYCWCGVIAEGRTEQCASHNNEDRRAERQSKKVQQVRQVQKVTAKRAGELQEYYKLRAEYLALYPACEVPECNLKTVEIHHQKGRENGRLLDTNFFMAVCHAHHVEFTEHSKEAIAAGHSKLRTGKTEG